MGQKRLCWNLEICTSRTRNDMGMGQTLEQSRIYIYIYLNIFGELTSSQSSWCENQDITFKMPAGAGLHTFTDASEALFGRLNCAMIWGLVYLGIRGLSILTSGIPRTWPFVRQIVPWPLLKIGHAMVSCFSPDPTQKISRPCYGQLFSFLFWLLPH